MKRTYIILISILIILAVGATCYIYSNRSSKVTEVNLGEEVTLRKNETLIIKGEEIYLTIKSFTNSPTPAGTQGIWSGLSVNYELKIGNKVYANSYETPYDVILSGTDYKTYAKVMVKLK